MSRRKRQLGILAALAASYLLGTIIAQIVAPSTRSKNHTDLAPVIEVPVHSVVSSAMEPLPAANSEP